MNTNPALSALSCGCDPGAPRLCDRHTIDALEAENARLAEINARLHAHLRAITRTYRCLWYAERSLRQMWQEIYSSTFRHPKILKEPNAPDLVVSATPHA